MVSFLTSPKAFKGKAKIHQYRAIRSWQLAAPHVQVVMYGDSYGIEEAGAELGVQVVKDIAQSPSGIPYFGAIADHAARSAIHDYQVYLNCDILLGGIAAALRTPNWQQFLLIGERIDLADEVYIDMGARTWLEDLRNAMQAGKASFHGPTGIDYFGFRRGLWADLPPVVVGRGGYDGALLAHCLRKRVPLIDATPSVFALHQFHDYSHVRGGQTTVFNGNEAQQNTLAAGSRHSRVMVSDATHVLRGSMIEAYACRGDRLRNFELQLRFRWRKTAIGLCVRLLWRLLFALKLRTIPRYDLGRLLDTAICQRPGSGGL